jgi:dTDP-3-amino-3,4,6-trideoxy-alpha-D-glucose transaminase
VPFIDLGAALHELKADLLADIAALIDAGAFTNGPPVTAFEEAFAAYCGVERCVGLASGLDALRLALLAVELEPGDEVIVPAQTFVATFEAVTQAGGIPLVVDIRSDDYTLDLEAADAALTTRTRVLLPVHLYGHMADMHAAARLAAHAGVSIVEDACQAHGARREGINPGAAAAAAAFSFYPGKNLGAMGDAGALVTRDGALALRARALREHGQTAKYVHDEEGYTARLDTIQALVLLRKLPLLDGWNRDREETATFYSTRLARVGDLCLPRAAPGCQHAWHLYVVKSARADALARFLSRRGIATGRHYPTPPHLCRAYAWLGHRRGSFPVAEALARGALSLPIFPGIREDQLESVVAAIDDFFRCG